jgi:hypothetical protein
MSLVGLITLFLNTFLNRCKALDKEQIFPARFVLPEIPKSPASWEEYPNLEIDLTKYKFIGSIYINYIYDLNPNELEKRVWTLFVFKQVDPSLPSIYNYKGEVVNYLITTIRLNYVDAGDINTKSYITHL